MSSAIDSCEQETRLIAPYVSQEMLITTRRRRRMPARKDAAVLANESTQRVLKRILEQSHEGLALGMVKSIRMMEDSSERVETRLRHFVIDMR
jgi:hypothetical protein